MARGCTVAARRPLAVLVVLLSALAGATGCSFTMGTAPSDPAQRTRKAAGSCTSSVYFPLLDTISAGVGVYNIGVSVAARDRVSLYRAEMSKKAGLALGITQAALFGAGAVYGYVQTARCDALRRETGLDPTPGTTTSGQWHPEARARSRRASESVGRAPGSEDDLPQAPAPGTDDAVSTELPSWSAFRRYPLPPESPARAPAREAE
jgi:hypothetical protein